MLPHAYSLIAFTRGAKPCRLAGNPGPQEALIPFSHEAVTEADMPIVLIGVPDDDITKWMEMDQPSVDRLHMSVLSTWARDTSQGIA